MNMHFFPKWNIGTFVLLNQKVSDYVSAITKLKLYILGCHLLVTGRDLYIFKFWPVATKIFVSAATALYHLSPKGGVSGSHLILHS